MLTTFFYVILLVISGILMAKAAEIIVNSLIMIARFLKMSEFAVSFILMATATSLPELFVGINAALDGNSVLALGNIIGSNIVDLTLVVGITVLLVQNIRVRSAIAKKDSAYMFLLSTFPFIFLLDGSLSRLEGITLVCFYLLYISRLLKMKNEFSKYPNHVSAKKAFYSLLHFLIGMILLIGISKILIFAAEKLAINLGIPLPLIGLVLVAIGTSLPELIFETKAVKKSHSEMVLGDLMGSVITNATLVLGITAIINPIEIQVKSIFYSSIIFLFFVLLLFNIFIRTERKLETIEAIILIFVYIGFIIVEFGLNFRL